MRSYRIFIQLVGLSIAFVMLVLQLFRLQTLPIIEAFQQQPAMADKAVAQRRTSIVIDEGRGRIVDRDEKPIAGVEASVLYLTAEAEENGEQLAEQVAAILGITADEWMNVLKTSQLPALWRSKGEREPMMLNRDQIARLMQLKQQSLRIIPYRRRYKEAPIASHLIGYVTNRDRVGAAGLERSFDPFLRPRGDVRLVTYQSGSGQPLAGLHHRIVKRHPSYYPLQLVTTLNSSIQRQAEQILTAHHIGDGTMVVLDIHTGDVLAMASTPEMNPNAVNPADHNWRNRALLAETPGSIFKIITAAAALETGAAKPGEQFLCKGTWKDGRLRCWKREGHGEISLEQGFAASCNLVFAELSERIGAYRLQAAAKQLGIGRRAGWSDQRLVTAFGVYSDFRQFDNEEAGMVFAAPLTSYDRSALAQTAIGQRDVRMSALQVAQLTAMIGGQGMLPVPRIVSEIRFSNHREAVSFPVKPMLPVLRPSTVRWLKQAMIQTTQSGTARLLADLPGGAAGKTGTAQIGKSERVNYWFTGFLPNKQPRYAVTVLARNCSVHSEHKALFAAKDMMRWLAVSSSQNQQSSDMITLNSLSYGSE